MSNTHTRNKQEQKPVLVKNVLQTSTATTTVTTITTTATNDAIHM